MYNNLINIARGTADKITHFHRRHKKSAGAP